MQDLLRTILVPPALALATVLPAQKTYTYSSVPGDPIGARIYKLDNGLTVYLSRNEDAPRIHTHIAVRAGSKHDPADATGLAHYLEHMLFKGTSRFGTTDWEKEKPLLDRISELYELRRATTDETKRDSLYALIDSVSNQAARIAIPSEYDKMISSLGARRTNAYTSLEQTVYINDIPSDEMERWMRIESERFQDLVLRLFHTELETVYEEFNMGQDDDRRHASKELMAALFPDHPYGTQTTIGTGEHLKNPSMVKIHEYFLKYYVPNNMAVIMCGDLDYDRTIALLDQYFGKWIPVPVEPFQVPQERPLTAPVQVEVFGPMAGWVDVAWRLGGTSTDDEVMATLVGRMLSNGQAGIMDLDLIQAQKVLDAMAYGYAMHDHGILQMKGRPRQGQSLEEVRDLLLQQVEKLARGEFDEWLIEAVVNDLRQSRIRSWSDQNAARAAAFTDAFITHKAWAEVLDFHDRMARVTKQQVMEFAQNKLGAGRVELFKRTGEKTNVYKVPKPTITPVEINRDVQSAWRTEWERLPKGEVEPVFVDYATAIDRDTLKSGVPLAHIANPSNDIFSLYYIADLGTRNDPVMDLAVRYLEFLGTDKLSARDLKKEFFKLGLRFGVDVGEDRATVYLSGLEKNLDKGVRLLEQLLANPRVDEAALIALVNDIGKERQDLLKNKSYILHTGLYSYARFGPRSPLTDALSIDSMRVIPAKDLIARIKGITAHEHRVFYYGSRPINEVKALLDKEHKVPAKLKPVPPAREYPELATNSNKVYFLEHDMVQTELLLVSKAGAFNMDQLPYASLFNEYFGSGLSSIVFQEIREAKALAYSANASYTTPVRADQAHYLRAFIGTQADKLNDAVDALLKLMNDMPRAQEQFDGAKEAARKVIASERITKAGIYWNWEALQRLGLDRDIRQDRYARIPAITMDEMQAFFDREIKGRQFTYLVIGKESSIDFKALERLGPVTKLTKKEVFGYDEQ